MSRFLQIGIVHVFAEIVFFFSQKVDGISGNSRMWPEFQIFYQHVYLFAKCVSSQFDLEVRVNVESIR